MEVTIEIKGNKAAYILEVLKNIKGVTVKSVDEKGSYISELKEAYHQTKLADEGKVKLKSFDELIDEV